MHKQNVKRAARAIEKEQGVVYSVAHQWVSKNKTRIIDAIRGDDGCDWQLLKKTACQLWLEDKKPTGKK